MLADRIAWLSSLLVLCALSCAAGPGVSVAAAQDEDEARPRRVDPADTPADGAPAADAPVATSGPPPRAYIVAVATSEGLDAVVARVGSSARSALRRLPVVWQQPDQLYLGYDAPVLESLLRARERLDEGRAAYENLELDREIELLRGAVDDFDAASGALEDPDDLGHALLYLGASYMLSGQTRDAGRFFARLQVQMPAFGPDADTFPPEIVQRWMDEAPRDATNPTASINVASDPPGAIAYVDFVPRGVTPLDVTELVGGQHVVRVARPGAAPHVQTVDVSRRGAGSVNAFVIDNQDSEGLAESVAAIGSAAIEEARSGPIADVAQRLGLDKIGVIRVSEATTQGEVDLELLVYDVASGRRVLRGAGTVSVDRGALEAGVQRLVAQGLERAITAQQAQDREQAVVTRPVQPVAPPPATGGDVTSEGWFWPVVIAGTAVVVAGVVVGVVVGTSGGPALGTEPGGQVVLEF